MKWEYSEVMAYLEDKIIHEEATEKEIDIYNDGKRYGKFRKSQYSKLNKEMNREWNAS